MIGKTKTLLIVLGLTVLSLTACSGIPNDLLIQQSSQTTPIPAQSPVAAAVPTTAAVSPAATPLSVSPLPTGAAPVSQSPLATVGPLPTSEPGTSTVTGILMSDNGTTAPMANALLYLGDILKSNDGKEFMVSADPATSLQTRTDANGRFVFLNVPPKKYGLLIYLATKVAVLRNPTSGEDLIIEAANGNTVDLGQLIYKGLSIQ